MDNLSSLEIDQLQKLLNDRVLLGVVRKVFDETVKRWLPETVGSDSNELLGAKYRAYEEARGMIEAAFQDILSYQKTEVGENKDFNKGR